MAQFDERLRAARQSAESRHEGEGGQVLSDSLNLQQAARQHVGSNGKKRGRRRKGDVIDLDQGIVRRSRRRRIFLALLVAEAFVAVVAVAVLIIYLWRQGMVTS